MNSAKSSKPRKLPPFPSFSADQESNPGNNASAPILLQDTEAVTEAVTEPVSGAVSEPVSDAVTEAASDAIPSPTVDLLSEVVTESGVFPYGDYQINGGLGSPCSNKDNAMSLPPIEVPLPNGNHTINKAYMVSAISEMPTGDLPDPGDKPATNSMRVNPVVVVPRPMRQEDENPADLTMAGPLVYPIAGLHVNDWCDNDSGELAVKGDFDASWQGLTGPLGSDLPHEPAIGFDGEEYVYTGLTPESEENPIHNSPHKGNNTGRNNTDQGFSDPTHGVTLSEILPPSVIRENTIWAEHTRARETLQKLSLEIVGLRRICHDPIVAPYPWQSRKLTQLEARQDALRRYLDSIDPRLPKPDQTSVEPISTVKKALTWLKGKLAF